MLKRKVLGELVTQRSVKEMSASGRS